MRKKHISKMQEKSNTIKLYLGFLLFIAIFQTSQVFSQAALITNVTASTGHPYIISQLATGTGAYSDRAYKVTSVPSFLNNAPYIQTPNDDKANKSTTTPYFTLSESATVYVAYDPRATAVPAWLNGWQKLASQVVINDPNISGLTLYSKTFPAGRVTLGGNLATPGTGALNMYLIIAVAQATQYTFTVNSTGNGTVTKSPDQASYTAGSSVNVSATPAAGQQFTGWSGAATGTSNPLTIIIDANKTLTANFAQASSQFNLTVNTNGGGTVTRDPQQAGYVSGTTVNITAIPAAGQQFTGWNGDATGTANPLTITMNANKTVTASFAATPSALITNISTTTGHPYLVGTLAAGTALYTDRAYIATDIPAFLNNATFIKTPNDDKSNKTTAALSFNLTQSAIVYVAYDPRATALPAWLNNWQKLASKVGINDPNVNAMALYSRSFAAGTITLGGNLASPAAGAATNYFVIASTQTAPLSFTVAVNGNGTVLKNPDQATYPAGTGISLTATPASGQQFSGWSGDAGGSANPLTIIIDANKTITATFTSLSTQYGLTLSTNGNGSITKNPDQPSYTSGANVTLSAVPANGQQFTGWGGDATGNVNPLAITMNANKSITAIFSVVSSAPVIATNPVNIYDNDVSGGAPAANRTIKVKNIGQSALTLSAINTTGINANQFSLSGLPVFPAAINPGDSISIFVGFNPTSTGLKTADITINSNDPLRPSTVVSLRALGTAGLGGANEPSLQSLLNLLEIQATVGDDNIATGIIHSNTTTQKAAILGEEVSVQRFAKAGTGAVTITPLAVFGPTFVSTVMGFGWYKSGDTASKSELLSVSNNPVTNGQTVNVNFTGTLTFDPASDTFGFFTRWPYFKNRHLFSEDNLNTFSGAAPHHARVYRYKKNGIIVPDSYVVAFEEDTTKLDYQDFVFIVSNIKKVTAATSVTLLPVADAYVRNGTFGNTNFGLDTALIVRSSSTAGSARYPYLKFSLAGITTVRSAKIRLYGANKDNASGINATLFGVNDDLWTENGITLNNAPVPLSSPLSSVAVTDLERYYEFDATAFVKQQLAGDKVVSLFVKDTTSKNLTITFNSKENSKNLPQLIVDTTTAVSNALLFVENMDGYPSNEHLVFSRIQIPWTRDTVYNADHDSIKLRLHNYGTNPLVVTDLQISVDSLWKIEKFNSSFYQPLLQLPATIIPGGMLDLTLRFTADDVGTAGFRRVKMLHETLTITSSDDKYPVKKVFLDGMWQNSAEGTHEPSSQEIITAFGYTSKTGFDLDDPDFGDSTKLKGDEIKPDFFLRADTSKPVTVRQLNAHHGCCHQQEYFKWFSKASPSELNVVFSHIGIDGQSLLPRKSLGGAPAGGTFAPPSAFGILVGTGNTTAPYLNTSKKLGIRVYKALDAAGNIIQDTYILANDYLGAGSNYDYNDNMYYVTNLKPAAGTVYYSNLNASPSNLDFGERVLQAKDSMVLNILSAGKTYADGSKDPAIVISSIVITGENQAEFSAEMPLTTTLNPAQATTVKVKFNPLSQGLKIADLLIYYSNSATPKRVPLYGIGKAEGVTATANFRINSGASTATVFGGKNWAADNQYAFDNLESYKNPAVKQIAGTDEDFLYLDEQSSNGDKKPFRYHFPAPNGTYYIRLHFAEIYWGSPGLGQTGGAGARTFSVKLENELRLANYDLSADAGTATAVIKNFAVVVTDGQLNIDFSATLNRPLVSAIEVYSFSAPAARAATVSARQAQPALIPAKAQSEHGAGYNKPRIFPNPLLNQNLAIYFPVNYRGIYSLQLVDITGRKYDLGKVSLDKKGAAIKIDISGLALKGGVYFLRIISNKNVTDVLKLIIR